MGFNPAKALNGVDLTNKVIMITGSTSGIGFATAQILVQYGAKVYLAARNADKAAACIKRIEESLSKSSNVGGSTVQGQALFHQLELLDPKEAKSSAEAFLEKEQRLDVLINCAAVVGDEFELGANGIQNTMNVNYFSPFVFTDTLLSLLNKTAAEPNSDVRIVNVASEGHKLVPNSVHFASREDFNVNFGSGYMKSLKRYYISKLAFVIWSRELQRRLSEEGTNIIVIAIHPGTVYTDKFATLHRLTGPLAPLVLIISRLVFMNVLDGAGTPIIAATSQKIRSEAPKYNGSYLVPIGKLSEPSRQAKDDELAKELWGSTEKFLKEWGL